MDKPKPSERKAELYALWNAQDGLLQQYRGMGLTHQSIIAAGALLVVTLFDDKWEAYRGMLVIPGGLTASLRPPHQQLVVVSNHASSTDWSSAFTRFPDSRSGRNHQARLA